MMVKWANDGALQANDGKILVNDGEMIVWSYTHFTIIDEHFTIINKQFTIINENLTIIPAFDHYWEAVREEEEKNCAQVHIRGGGRAATPLSAQFVFHRQDLEHVETSK